MLTKDQITKCIVKRIHCGETVRLVVFDFLAFKSALITSPSHYQLRQVVFDRKAPVSPKYATGLALNSSES